MAMFDLTRGYPSHVATSSRGQALAKVLQFTLRRGIDVPEITVLGSGDVDFDEILLPLVAQNGWVDWMAWLRRYGRHNLMEDLVSICFHIYPMENMETWKITMEEKIGNNLMGMG